MRLRKGDQVEVLNKKEVSSGSWSCAEILSGNGRSYSVKFLSSDEAVEKVPRKAIRPCPPPFQGSNDWDAGDLAEAFHNSSWKHAKIMKIVGVNRYIVRILGSPLDIMVGSSNLRMRQAWHDGRWILLGKSMEESGSLSRNRQIEPNMVRSKDQQLVALPAGSRKRLLPSDAGLREGTLIPGTSTHIQADSCTSSVGRRGDEEEEPCSYEEVLVRSHSLWRTPVEEILGSFSGWIIIGRDVQISCIYACGDSLVE
ncbi:hypothetical protein IC575_002834 [Cucumis melo]